jgi:hypothetical protein
MRESGREFGSTEEPAHNLAKCGRPPPVAVTPMLELTRRLGQVNAYNASYNFSLSFPNSPIFSGS